MLICPHCEQPLTRDGQTYRCPQSHAFDIAREGYVNLLRRPSKLQADTREMLVARQRFLDGGYYQPLAEAVSATVARWLRSHHATDDGDRGGILDAGCGEGYFTCAVERSLSADQFAAPDVASAGASAETPPFAVQATGNTFPLAPIFAVDLSRDGIRLATRRERQTRDATATGGRRIVWVVADLKQRFPFASESLSAITNIFAPHSPEFARVLQPGGLLLIVIPGRRHLQEARERLTLLDIQAEKRERLLAQLTPTFALVDEQSLSYTIELDAAAQADLRLMTPHKRSRHATPANHPRQTPPNTQGATGHTPTDTLTTGVAFTLLSFAKA